MDVFDLTAPLAEAGARDELTRRALSFGPVADLYDRIRPSYPTAAVHWLLGPAPSRVLDLGAGTGIFSRLLTASGHEVIAVEPDSSMRRLIGAGITAIAGSAEEIPLPDASVDAVVAAQSYHWFNRDRAHDEIARVLIDGGIFGPIWNLRDETIDWVARISNIAESEAQKFRYSSLDCGMHFTPSEHIAFRHATHHTADTLIALVRSRSSYLTATTEHRAEIEAELRNLVAPMAEPFELPYVTVAMKCRRVPRA